MYVDVGMFGGAHGDSGMVDSSSDDEQACARSDASGGEHKHPVFTNAIMYYQQMLSGQSGEVC